MPALNDDVTREILKHMHTSEPYACSSSSNPSVALRQMALTCRAFYFATQSFMPTEVWITRIPNNLSVEELLYQRSSHPDAHFTRKVVLYSSIRKGMRNALQKFASLKELVLVHASIIADELYPILISLPSLRIFAALHGSFYKTAKDMTRRRRAAPAHESSTMSFDFSGLRLTHLAMSIGYHSDPGEAVPLFLLEQLLCLPTLEDVDIDWTPETADALEQYYYRSLSATQKSEAFRSLRCLTLHIARMDRLLAAQTSWWLNKCPRYRFYDGTSPIHQTGSKLEFHLYVDRFLPGDLFTAAEDVEAGPQCVGVLGAVHHLSNSNLVVLAGSLAGAASYSGPLSTLGLIISSPLTLGGGNGTISKKEWAKAECTPNSVAPSQGSQPMPEIEPVDSGVQKLVIKDTQSLEFLSRALTLVAVGRADANALTGRSEFVLHPSTSPVFAPLHHVDLKLPRFDVETFHAVQALFGRTLETLIFRFNGGTSLVQTKPTLHHLADFFENMPHLRACLVFNWPGTIDDSEREAIREDVLEFAVSWASLCPSLRDLALDEVRYRRRWPGDPWAIAEISIHD